MDPVPANALGEAWSLGLAPLPPPFARPAYPRGLQPLREGADLLWLRCFEVGKGRRGRRGRGSLPPFPEGGGLPFGSPPFLPSDLQSGEGRARDPREARRTESSPERHRPAGQAASLRPRAPRTCPGATRRLGHPSFPSVPPPLLPTARPSAQVPRTAGGSRSPGRAVCTYRDFLEAGSARASPGRVPGGRDAEARL